MKLGTDECRKHKYCNSDCDDPAVAAEAQRRHQIILSASEGRLPPEAFFFEAPVPPDKLDAVVSEINCENKKWTVPPRLNIRLGIPSRTLQREIVVGISSSFIADLQTKAAPREIPLVVLKRTPGQMR